MPWKPFRNTLSVFLLASISTNTFALYPDVESMLEALRPTAAQDAPELNTLIIALDAIPNDDARRDALETLNPLRDGSLRAASEGPMQQFHNVLFDRLVHVEKNHKAGVNSGDLQMHFKKVADQIKNKVNPKPHLAQNETNPEVKAVVKTTEEKTNAKATTTVTSTTDKAAPKATKTATTTTTETTTKADPEDPATINGANGPTTTTTTTSSNGDAAATATTTTTTATDNTTTQTTTDAAATTTTDTTSTDAATDTTATTDVTTDTTTPEEEVAIEDIKKGTWIHVLGENIGQDARDLVPGYDADTLGIMIGRDVLQTPNYTIGLAIGYQNAEVDQRNLSGSYLRIKRFQGTIYNAYEWDCPFFFHSAFTVAFNHYDNHRYMLIPPFGDVPLVFISNSLFWGTEINAYAETGYKWDCGGPLQITPKLMLGYTHFTFGSYIEDDAFGYDLDVKYHDLDSLPVGLGIKVAYENQFERAYVTPEIHINLYHDLMHDKQTSTALFTGGGFEFLSEGSRISRNVIDIGAGFTVHSYTNTLVTIQYDYAARSDYHRQQALIRVRHEWA